MTSCMTNNLQNVQLVFILFFQSPGSGLRCNFLISRHSKSQRISSFAHTLWWTMRGIPERKKKGGLDHLHQQQKKLLYLKLEQLNDVKVCFFALSMPWVVEAENNDLQMTVFDWSIIMSSPSDETPIECNSLSLLYSKLVLLECVGRENIYDYLGYESNDTCTNRQARWRSSQDEVIAESAPHLTGVLHPWAYY